ncbi:hypothetical protein [Parabacteroides sp. Marseille-P3160]|uniref:hypothetical protein n=1 Tax=Parabacteroides sp. Marseille-P3160 TaxID=1917887 RepID=UPI0009BB62BC|nr:hypothetical protein [Parabacteroides sp. Marseille-P3160]
MWNKIRFILIFCLFLQIGFAQEWLGQSRKQILSGIERKVQQAEILPDTDSLLKINCQEEDERCRKFQVSYIFTFDSDRCISYRRILPLHNYWATTFQELVSQQEAKGSGETLDVDGEMLLTDYAFEAYTLHLSIEANHLNALFKIKDQHR